MGTFSWKDEYRSQNNFIRDREGQGHNLCVGGEYGIDAYYLAKLLLEKQKPERIIYEVDPGYFATQKRRRK